MQWGRVIARMHSHTRQMVETQDNHSYLMHHAFQGTDTPCRGQQTETDSQGPGNDVAHSILHTVHVQLTQTLVFVMFQGPTDPNTHRGPHKQDIISHSPLQPRVAGNVNYLRILFPHKTALLQRVIFPVISLLRFSLLAPSPREVKRGKRLQRQF